MSDATPIHALLDHRGEPSRSTHELLAKADCIVAVDVMTGAEAVVWGLEWLQEIIDSRQSKEGRVLRIELDSGTGELETLLELVRSVHGRHDYKGKP